MRPDNKNILIKGIELTPAQKAMIRNNNMRDQNWVDGHSFWFKNGVPSPDLRHPVINQVN